MDKYLVLLRREGDRVKAKVSGWTKFYSGEITRVNSDGTYDIKFEDGERKRGVTESQIEGGGDDTDRFLITQTSHFLTFLNIF